MDWTALVIDDDPGIRQSLRLCLEVSGARVLGVATAEAALEALDRGRFDVVFLDLWLGSDSGLAALPEILRRQPEVGVIVVTAYASIESAVEAVRAGAADYLPKPFSPDQVRLAAERVLQHAAAAARGRRAASRRCRPPRARSPSRRAASGSATFMQTAARVAAADCVVLLRGESGTGKNIMARWLRAHSPRQDQPFVTVHCPLLSGDLMTSALFGYRKGAFTGATADTPGKVEEAEHGTLFLDEVAELTPDAQSRLLRFLNDRTYERLGDTKERQADVRVIAATNRVAGGGDPGGALSRRPVLPAERRDAAPPAAAGAPGGRAAAGAPLSGVLQRTTGPAVVGVLAAPARRRCSRTRGRAICASCATPSSEP